MTVPKQDAEPIDIGNPPREQVEDVTVIKSFQVGTSVQVDLSRTAQELAEHYELNAHLAAGHHDREGYRSNGGQQKCVSNLTQLQEHLLELSAKNKFLTELLSQTEAKSESRRLELNSVKRSLRILHCQRPSNQDNEVTALVSQLVLALEQLDQLAVHHQQGLHEKEGDIRRFCLLSAQHTELTEASRLSRLSYEKAFSKVLKENQDLRERCLRLDARVQAEESEKRASVAASEEQRRTAEAKSTRLEEELESLRAGHGDVLRELKRDSDSVREELRDAQARVAKATEAKKQREDNIRRLMALVKELEARNVVLLQRQEAMEEELTEHQLQRRDLGLQLAQQRLVVAQLDRHCVAYEQALQRSRRPRPPSPSLHPSARAPASHLSAPSGGPHLAPAAAPPAARTQRTALPRTAAVQPPAAHGKAAAPAPDPASRPGPLPPPQHATLSSGPRGPRRVTPTAVPAASGRQPASEGSAQGVQGVQGVQKMAAHAAGGGACEAGAGAAEEGRLEQGPVLGVRVERRRGRGAPERETAIRARAVRERSRAAAAAPE